MNTKKIITILLMFSLAGCSTKNTSTDETTEPTTQTVIETTTAEPVKPVDSPEAFLDLGIFIDVPKESESVSYSILNGNIAEIDFQYAQTQYILRGSNTEKNLTYDVDDDYDEVMDSIDDGTRQVDIKTTIGGCRVSEWVYEGTNFALMSQQPVEADAFTQLCLWLAFPE